MPQDRWRVASSAPPDYLHALPELPPLAAQLLYNRGIASSKAEAFLQADESLAGDPFALPEMGRAVARVYQALLSGEAIAVYGDFDADGVTATALLVQALEELGGRAVPYIPHRVDEGHGLNAPALRSLAKQGCTLVITADCGITGVHGGALPKGMDLIVTDHHLPPPELPGFFAAVNPHLSSPQHPEGELTGVGTAFKLVQALFSSLGKTHDESHLELVPLGTIADLGPLVGENRYLVRRGLAALHRSCRPGLLALAAAARLSLEQIDAEDIGYALAPRLNAAGRLDHAMASFRLLTTTSSQEAEELAARLETLNTRRQELTRDLMALARAEVLAAGPLPPFLLVGGAEYLPGVAGLVAGRLAEEFHRPALVYHRGENESRGSGRSIPEFNIAAALEECAPLLTRHGGHKGAAGLVLPTQNLETLGERLREIAGRELAGQDLRSYLSVDAETPISALPGPLMAFLARLAPFGQGNPPPTFFSRGLQVLERRPLGEGDHVRLKLRESGVVWDAVAFNQGHRWDSTVETVDVVYTVRPGRWRGRAVLELTILDFAPSGG